MTHPTTIRVLVLPCELPAYLRDVPAEGHRDADGMPQSSVFNKIVGGWLEGVALGDSFMYINEDAIRLALAPNPLATAVVRALSPRTRMPVTGIAGDAFIAGVDPDGMGSDASVGDAMVVFVTNMTGYEPQVASQPG